MSAAAPAPPVNPDRPETGHSAGKSSLSSKSDPNQALRGEEAVYSVGSSGFSLRSMQHRDREGKIISTFITSPSHQLKQTRICQLICLSVRS
ncbi:hypothetical protein ALUC_50441S [Aspergillus luchuensis]|nr:hypothetical protein ALUC_50441S [Aspergillus luchuensis]